MVITENKPEVRTFTVHADEKELRLILLTLGNTSHSDSTGFAADAGMSEADLPTYDEVNAMYDNLKGALR